MKKRNLYNVLWDKFKLFKQMIFLVGPRQSGKTTFAQEIAHTYPHSTYFNWDIYDQRALLIQDPYFYAKANRDLKQSSLVIFDELHKYSEWKNYLKGAFDRDKEIFKFLVTGSGRLDLFRKGGDSLAGRYLLFHLWPFTIAELLEERDSFVDFLQNPLDMRMNSMLSDQDTWSQLKVVGGFPDPFLMGREDFSSIWSSTYMNQLVREDIRDASGIQKIDKVEMLLSLLPYKVGSSLSLNNLAGDVGVAFDSVKNWVQLFDDFFLTFRIKAWSTKLSRMISKEQKLYFMNYTVVKNEAARFENMVALELLRAVSSWNENGFGSFQLHFVKMKDGPEVDFMICQNHEPFLLIECKLSDQVASPALEWFQDKFQIPAIQLIDTPGVCRQWKRGNLSIQIASASSWLKKLP
jgi:predicted AAA+ superfamily ATPase